MAFITSTISRKWWDIKIEIKSISTDDNFPWNSCQFTTMLIYSYAPSLIAKSSFEKQIICFSQIETPIILRCKIYWQHWNEIPFSIVIGILLFP